MKTNLCHSSARIPKCNVPPQTLSWVMVRSFVATVLVSVGVTAQAHPADESQLLVRLAKDAIELRFSFNLSALDRVAELDLDHDAAISPAELDAALPAVVAFLREKTLVALNGSDIPLPPLSRSERIWPHEHRAAVTRADMPARRVDLHFTLTSSSAVIEELWLGFEVFEQLGATHRLEAHYEQSGEPTETIFFTASEPEYLWATAWKPQAPSLSGDATTAAWWWLGAGIATLAGLAVARGRSTR
jgi:hypothetical protein